MYWFLMYDNGLVHMLKDEIEKKKINGNINCS